MNNFTMPVANADGTFGSAPTTGSPQGQGSQTIPGPPTPPPSRNQLRVMVAGESGLGKTTFLNNIFRHLNGDQNPMDAEAVVKAQGGMFGQSKTLKIEERNFVFRTPVRGGSDGDHHEYKFFLVDTPGYGDHENVSKSFQPVLNYIVKGNKKYLADIRRTGRIPEDDGRTDVCIYFIAAHRCKPIDIVYMKQLSKVVAVIPVIGKSDSMTVEEMKNFKAEIVRDAGAASKLRFFEFSEGAWNKCKAVLQVGDQPKWVGGKQPPPYAVISSNIDLREGKNKLRIPARRYPWGDCRVMDTNHSDNRYLQCLLLEVGFHDVKDEMERRHDIFIKQPAKPAIKILLRKARNLALQVLKSVDQSQRGSSLFLLVAVVTVACALLVVVLLFQGWTVGANPPGSSADWGDIISRIDKLEGAGRILESAEGGGDPLHVLRDVLEESYKKPSETQCERGSWPL